MKRTYLPVMTAISALSLAPLSVHAQYLSLNTGDIVMVDGTGTHGTISGALIANTTSSYTTTYSTVTTNGTATFTLGSGGSLKSATTTLQAAGSGPVNITGGSITGTTALFTSGIGSVTITGGTFNASTDLRASSNSTIDLYGAFDGLTLGQTQTLPSSFNGVSGSFSSTLENNTVAQTFTYYNSGTITLHDVAPAPEPSQFAALSIGILGVGALALRARRRAA